MKKALCIVVFLLSLLLMANWGFAQEKIELEIRPRLDTTALGQSVSEYTLGKGDIVKIDVRNQPEFSGEFIVGPDGNIQYDFVGDIKAEGLTKYELRDALSQKLERYVKGPEVSVVVAQYLSKFIYVLGEVGRPGKYPMKGDSVPLREALMAANLPTPDAALRRTYIVTPDEVKPKFQKVDIYKLLYEGKLEQDLVLAPGDVVVVPSTVPSEINRALSKLLSPFSQAASSAAIYKTLTR